MKRLLSLFRMFGLDFEKMRVALSDVPRFIKNLKQYRQINSESHKLFPNEKTAPCLGDSNTFSGCGRGAYFYQDLWVAQQIFLNAPIRHIDVGSRVDGFVAHVASFRALEVIDIRPLPDDIPHVCFRQADMMGKMPQDLEECCDSVSCLHALEHFGLGRYGDPIDPDGWRKGFDNLCVMLKIGGRLYLSVPIGPSRTEFNSQRVFSLQLLASLFRENFTIEKMALIDDAGNLRTKVDLTEIRAADNFGIRCGCGIVIAVKKK